MLGPWCLKVKTRFLQQLEMQEDFPDITKMLQQGYPELKTIFKEIDQCCRQ